MIRRAGLFGGTLGVALVASSSWPIVQGALAKDHGVMGQTWAIAEPDLLATIDIRLKTLQANGGIERMQTALREKTEERVRNPIPVAGIGAVREIVPAGQLVDRLAREYAAAKDELARL